MSYLFLLLLGSIWGASYLFIKIAGSSFPPVTLVALRTSLAGITLLIVLLLRRESLPPRRAPIWKWLAAMGLLNSVIPYTLITWGEIHISSGLAAILVGAMPIFTVVLAHVMTRDEKVTPSKMLGVALGFVGVVILFLPDLANGLQWSLAGGLAVVCAAISYALAAILARRHLKGAAPATTAFGQMLIASAILIPASLLLDQPWTLAPLPAAWASILTLSIAGTAFAYLMYYWLIAHVGATRTSLVTYISPVIAVLLGALVLNETLQWNTLVGLVCIIAGVGSVNNLAIAWRRAPVVSPKS